MAYVEFIVETVNSQSGSGNPALSTFHLLSPVGVTDAEAAAQLIAFLNFYGRPAGTSFNSISRRASSALGASPVAWPTAEYTALRAANGNLAELGGYGASFGEGEAAPIGTSWTVSLYTAVAGRKTTGRLYNPWVNLASIDNGMVLADGRIEMAKAYRTYLLGQNAAAGGLTGVTPPDALNPVVHSATAGDTLITTPIVSDEFASLKTRRR